MCIEHYLTVFATFLYYIIKIYIFLYNFNRTLNKLVYDKEDDWDDYLDSAICAINAMKSTTYYLMHGHHQRLPMEAEAQQSKNLAETAQMLNSGGAEVNTRIDILKKLNLVYEKVPGNIEKAQEKQKKQYDRKGATVCVLENGDSVLQRNMLQKTKKGHKMEDKWTGPYIVSNLDESKGLCNLTNQEGKVLKTKCNVKQLKKYHPPTVLPVPSVVLPGPSSIPLVPSAVLPDPSSAPPIPSTVQPSPPTEAPCPSSVLPAPSSVPPSPSAVLPDPSSSEEEESAISNLDAADELEKVKSINVIISNLDMKVVVNKLHKVKTELEDIVDGTIASPLYEVASTGKSSTDPTLTKRNLPLFIKFGGFDEEQNRNSARRTVSNVSLLKTQT